ncbi:ABC transporter permease [Legionella yabuuchiae]|uniref:ABC transporter permease n=1 Tax=Legionella yabuuchiae TaxID=376727 RepID=UPI001055F0A8|nr:ABC transporter permease [Legionella yabuuchiae]
MTTYLFRRILYMIPILLGINILTFALFFMVNSPDDMARMQLGEKHVSEAVIENWKAVRGYDLPLFYNEKKSGLESLTQTLFYQKSFRLFLFDFGMSDAGRDISYDVSQRMWPSLAIAIPVFILGLFVNIVFAMLMAFFRSSYLDLSGVVFCIILMSISTMFYIIGGQYLFGKVLRLVPISGYDDGLNSVKFVALPILVAVISGIGGGSRWYRTLFLEEMHRDYVKTARAKGLSELSVLFRHVLKNTMLPILTGIVVIIPSLFMGSLVLESFFGIPGLGSYIIDAIQQQDFAIVRAMVFLGSILYIIGLILTDISYTLVDPRVRLQ